MAVSDISIVKPGKIVILITDWTQCLMHGCLRGLGLCGEVVLLTLNQGMYVLLSLLRRSTFILGIKYTSDICFDNQDTSSDVYQCSPQSNHCFRLAIRSGVLSCFRFAYSVGLAQF